MPEKNFDGQSKHGQQEKHHEGVLEQTHALVVLRVVTAEQRVSRDSCYGVVASNNHCTEDAFPQIGSDAEYIRQVSIDFINQAIVIPGLPWPEPLPARSANKRSDHNHRDPQNDKSKKKSP